MHLVRAFVALIFVGSFITDNTAQVNADFTSNVNSGCGSLQVSFTDQSSSSGNITNWSWDLGGVNSSNQNPGRIFGSPGNYTICLTVSDDNGNSDTECKSNFIEVFNLPQPAFSSNIQTGCNPETIQFFDESTFQDGAITEWIWGLGGSSGVIVDNGSLPSITSTYSNADSYTISLTVEDENGCVNTLTQNDFLTINDLPEIDVSFNDTFSCTTPFILTTNNNNPDPNINYTWDFGNGSPIFQGTNPPSVSYFSEGSYTITIIAENNLTSCIDTMELVDIINIGNAASFLYSDTEICLGEAISFINTSNSNASEFQWDFGDGSFSNEVSPIYNYTSSGCYTVTLSALVNGCWDTFSSSTCIEVFPNPSVDLANNNAIGCELPHTVQFFGFSDIGMEYSWDFGDGNSSALQNPQHTFTEFGDYIVNLELTDANGCSNTIADTISILQTEASINLPALSGCSPVSFTLEENTISITPVSSWEWWIDTSFSDPNSPIIISTEESPFINLSDTGVYDITLIVTNTLGCSDTVTNFGAIEVGIPPEINFEAIPLIACVDETVQFTDLSSNFTDYWQWDFGDGEVSSMQNPSNDYAYPDTFDVTLTAAHNGCFNTLSFDDYIIVQEPLADFELERDCNNPFDIFFLNNSTGADSVFWNFGIGTGADTSSIFEPSTTFPSTGNYTVTLYAFNFTTGCIDSTEQIVTITDPLAGFSLSPLSGCSPLNVQVSNDSEFAATWEWIAPGANVVPQGTENPTLVYNNPGLYSNVQLIITDIFNCQDTVTFTDSILVDGVDAEIVALPSGGCFPLNVAFFENANSYFSPEISWDWNIHNGLATSSDPNTGYFFQYAGNYNVELTVVNARGCVGSVSETIYVTNPTIGFEADSISCPNDPIQFNNLSAGSIPSFQWDFGDGTTSTQVHPTHQFANPGVYNVCLRFTDSFGCQMENCQEINIVIPIADFTIDSTASTCPPFIAEFENTSINGLFYEWDFGDSSGISILEHPPHVYTVPGAYDVQLITSINENCTDTLLVEDLIQLGGPVGEFGFDLDSTCVGFEITFWGASASEYLYIWDFGDGNLDTTQNVSTDTIQYAYQEPGEYIPNLILIDQDGCLRVIVSPDTIRVALLDIDFLASDTTLCEDINEVSFINLTNSSTAIEFIEWTFGNGTPQTSTDFEPTVTFPDSGNFDVSLVIDNGFCIDTLNQSSYIGAGSVPDAVFTASSSSICVPLGIQFFDSSTSSNGAIAEWEWDFGDLGSSDIQNPVYNYSNAGDYNVILTVTTEFGCTDTMSMMVTVYEPFEPLIQLSEPEICIGDQTQIGATFQNDTTGMSYYWQDDPTLSCTDCLNPFVDPLITTSYFLISTTSQGCMDTAEIIVNVLPYSIPDISLTADTNLCIGESIQLEAFATGNVSYEWDQNTQALSCYNCNDPMADPDISSLYFVTVTNEFGCDAIDSVLIEVVDQNIPFAGDDRTICLGDSVQLQLSFEGDPIWQNSNGLSCNNCNDPIASPNQTSTYIVQTVTADFTCEVMDTITINVYDPDGVEAGIDSTICLGEEFTLVGTADVNGSILWTPSTGLNSSTSLTTAAAPNATTTYVLSLTEDLCTLIDSVEIEVQFNTMVESMDYEICEGDTVQLEVFGDADIYEWNPGMTLSDPFTDQPLAYPSETTNYTLQASLSTCSPDTAIATVIVNNSPEIISDFRFDKFPGVDVQLFIEIDSMSSGYSFEWLRTDGLSCINCPDPVLSIDTSGFYPVLIFDDETGCVTEHLVFINLLRTCNPDLISVPNIFTPNDDGYNDQIGLFSGTITDINSFKIFNRWGALIFETQDMNESWDGFYKNQKMPSGVYVYLVETVCPLDGSVLIKKGDFSLVR